MCIPGSVSHRLHHLFGNAIKLLTDFEVFVTDSLLSDGHSLLKWSVCANLENKKQDTPEPQKKKKTFRNWDSKHIESNIT